MPDTLDTDDDDILVDDEENDAQLEDEATVTEVERLLEDFEHNPAELFARQPVKTAADGQPAPPISAFSEGDVETSRHVIASDRYRKPHSMVHEGVIISLSEVLPGKAPFEGSDRAENLVDDLKHTRLSRMHCKRLRKGQLEESPWSDDYWGLYLGCLGHRYADPSFPSSYDWATNRAYVESQPAPAIVASNDTKAIDRLSPSEKYDLLVGDQSGTLTTEMWNQGRRYYERDGEVETWMGICHGWAQASYMLPRPRHHVDALAADGVTKLRFYPSDIKGLASLLWAQAPTVSRFIGGRCNDKEPPVDNDGRLISQRAFDTNPGTWHLAVVNQIGVAERSVVMDATYDYEVWNQPIFAYRYSYFNPKTRKFHSSLKRAMVDYKDFRAQDKFAAHRSSKTKKIVGVMMKLTYVVETAPSQREQDSESRDGHRMVRYLYDLELDRKTRILGGEWYQNKHPDFLWTPPPTARARTSADAYASGSWFGPREVVPKSWRDAARFASRGSKGAPLGKIVERLVAFANA